MKKYVLLFMLGLFAALLCGCSEGGKPITVTVTVECLSAVESYGEFTESKRNIMPSDGIFISDYEISVNEGSSCFEALREVCSATGLHMDYTGSSLLGTEYIRGLGNLYEFDLGAESGWLYSINGEKSSTGASSYKLTGGEEIRWFYTLTAEK